MRSTDRRTLVALISITAGCASTSAPAGFLPTPQVAAQNVYGGWVDAEIGKDPVSRTITGELLAITGDSVWIRQADGSGVVTSRVTLHGNVTRYATNTSAVVGATAAGALSAIATGWFLILITPAWAITGSIAGVHDTYAARLPLDAEDSPALLELAAFARFPAGVPAGYDARFTRISQP